MRTPVKKAQASKVSVPIPPTVFREIIKKWIAAKMRPLWRTQRSQQRCSALLSVEFLTFEDVTVEIHRGVRVDTKDTGDADVPTDPNVSANANNPADSDVPTNTTNPVDAADPVVGGNGDGVQSMDISTSKHTYSATTV